MLTALSCTARCTISRRRDGAATFLQRLINALNLQALLGVHLLLTAVLLFEFLQPRHDRGFHAAELAAQVVKQCRTHTHAVFPAQLRDGTATAGLLENGDDLALRKP